MVDYLIAVAEEYADEHGGDFREVSMSLLENLLGEGLMEIGDLGESGFEPWTSSVAVSLARFRAGCEACGWRPMGGLWWLAVTALGRAWLQRPSATA
ncbi:hypothetical protein [Streptomyces sp. HNM0574]|uniref:hypothetical protein n=1 Tax=Streptomyces sp. HNM0574 TaxID=2714954 RepID=UPI00146F2B0F|nr:hypothetical protein [Streptomyces sp. HNM0574]NLU68002.1 type II toxin-antitoxin system VapC family toxin [Streptomyces sp. HNM0574]